MMTEDESSSLSVSMFIEGDLSTLCQQQTPSSFASYPIDQRRIYQWVKDDSVTSCHRCQSVFTVLNRRHHCRCCGKIFCGQCSSFFVSIPDRIQTSVPQDQQNMFSLLDYRMYLHYGKRLLNTTTSSLHDSRRVCHPCYQKIIEIHQLSEAMGIFDALPMDVLEICNLGKVCKSWNKISRYYLSRFREIQYYFTGQEYSQWDKQVIHLNRYHFAGHSKWLVQLICMTHWSNKTEAHDTMTILRQTKRQTRCWELMCTRSCHSQLEFEDLVIVFSKQITYIPLIQFLCGQLQQQNSDEELSCYLPLILEQLVDFYKDFTTIASLIEVFLIRRCRESDRIASELFWLLTRQVSCPGYASNLRQRLVQSLPTQVCHRFQEGYDCTMNLIQLVKNVPEASLAVQAIQQYIHSFPEWQLPFCAGVAHLDGDAMSSVESKTAPIILPYQTKQLSSTGGSSHHRMMLKRDDVRKEELMMRLIRLIEWLLKKEEGMDLSVVTYRIIPISEEYGMIEMVEQSHTLFTIKEEKGFSIQNFLLEQNPNDLSYRDRFTKSCAAYTVITYLLGIGDRHLDNIMITEEGKLFHIDFGYIFGQDPKLVCPEIRLTPEMIDTMGGIRSTHYQMYREYCGKAYNCIRRHAPIFFNLSQMLRKYDPTLTDEIIRSHILQRFIPGETYEEAKEQFLRKIDRNVNTYSDQVIDYFHKRYKTTVSSSTPPPNSVIGKAVDIASGVVKGVRGWIGL